MGKYWKFHRVKPCEHRVWNQPDLGSNLSSATASFVCRDKLHEAPQASASLLRRKRYVRECREDSEMCCL